jgi:quercetin dioxygenase-like cupin family protein
VPRVRLVGAIAAAALAGATGAAVVIAQSSPAPAVQRDALAASPKVQGAKGRTLALSRVKVPAGASIPLHHHLGTQVAYIQAGTLTYTVVEGSVKVMRGSSDDGGKLVRRIGAGETGRIRTGQWLVEQPSTIHRARNDGSTQVVILISNLIKTGAPPSTPVP